MAYPHTRRSVLAAVSMITLLSLTACGSERPSVADIKGQIAEMSGDTEVSDDQMNCLAKAYYDSDLSDEAVRFLVEAEDVTAISPEDLSKEDQAASKKLYEPLVKCLAPAE
ncbi:hypothetical protein [Nocardioides albertanoniae]|nr:hypothetical protein [Nocardioides albertanoniae]